VFLGQEMTGLGCNAAEGFEVEQVGRRTGAEEREGSSMDALDFVQPGRAQENKRPLLGCLDCGAAVCESGLLIETEVVVARVRVSSKQGRERTRREGSKLQCCP